MTDEELRAHFDLKPCPNPAHAFSLGKLMGEWRIAEDDWSQLVGQNLQTLLLSYHTTKSTSGIVLHSITIFRLKIIWSIWQ